MIQFYPTEYFAQRTRVEEILSLPEAAKQFIDQESSLERHYRGIPMLLIGLVSYAPDMDKPKDFFPIFIHSAGREVILLAMLLQPIDDRINDLPLDIGTTVAIITTALNKTGIPQRLSVTQAIVTLTKNFVHTSSANNQTTDDIALLITISQKNSKI